MIETNSLEKNPCVYDQIDPDEILGKLDFSEIDYPNWYAAWNEARLEERLQDFMDNSECVFIKGLCDLWLADQIAAEKVEQKKDADFVEVEDVAPKLRKVEENEENPRGSKRGRKAYLRPGD